VIDRSTFGEKIMKMRIDKPELRVQSVRFFRPEQWRLQYGLGPLPENQAALDSGNGQG